MEKLSRLQNEKRCYELARECLEAIRRIDKALARRT
jgi:hypothetical protein